MCTLLRAHIIIIMLSAAPQYVDIRGLTASHRVVSLRGFRRRIESIRLHVHASVAIQTNANITRNRIFAGHLLYYVLLTNNYLTSMEQFIYSINGQYHSSCLNIWYSIIDGADDCIKNILTYLFDIQ